MVQNKTLDSVLNKKDFKSLDHLRAYLIGVLEAETESVELRSQYTAEDAIESLQQAVEDYKTLKKELKDQ